MKDNAIKESTVCSSSALNTQAPQMIGREGQNFVGQKWLTGKEVCELLHITSRTLQNYRDRKYIPFSNTGSKIYYKQSDIEAYLERHYIKASI